MSNETLLNPARGQPQTQKRKAGDLVVALSVCTEHFHLPQMATASSPGLRTRVVATSNYLASFVFQIVRHS